MSLAFPDISPIAFEIGPVLDIGPFLIRWYALAYLAGFLLGWAYARYLAARFYRGVITLRQIDDFMTFAIIGVIAGGRLGYVLFYQGDYYLNHPIEALYLWQGGMSFHGGAAGVIIAIIVFAIFSRIPMFKLADIVCACVPIGLCFGRVANFVNAELYGRVTSVPWGMVFPGTDGQPRHASQLYESAGEGMILFLILAVLMRMRSVRDRPGIISGVFLAGYATVRFMVEFVREPDVQLGTLSFGLTMGQTLCLPMFAGAVLVIVVSKKYWSRHDHTT